MGNGPTYYRNLTTAPSKEFIATEISTIRSKNKSRRIHDKAVNLTEYRQMLNSTFEKNSMAASSNYSRETSRLS